MKTAVLVTRTRWTEIPRLRHQVARALAGEYRILFVETPASWRENDPEELSEVEADIFRYQLHNRVRLPGQVRSLLPGIHERAQQAYLEDILGALKRLGWSDPPVLVNFNHDATRIMESERFGAKLYVCNDDWIAKARGRLGKRMAARQEARVAAGADICLAVSHPLVESLRRYNPRTRLFLPGHDFAPAETRRGKRARGAPIRALFMGNLNRRVNLEWLKHAAAQPGLEMHVVGTVEVDGKVTDGLRRAGIHFHQPKFGAELQRFLEEADVLVIPYLLRADVLAVTASNKLFSYIAAERPVVISDMPHFIDFGPGVIYRARSPEEFVETVRAAALEDSEELRARRREIARAHSWEARGRELRGLIENVRAGDVVPQS